MRQLLSVLETQYSGDTVLLVFPDGTGPALLECLIAGIPLNKVHEFNYKSGEIRLDITYDNVRARMPTTMSVEYKDRLSFGREELVVLRENPDEIINVKDQQYEKESREYEEKKAMIDIQNEKERIEKEEAKEQLRDQMKEEREMKIKAEREAKTNGDEDHQNPIIAGIGALGVGVGGLLLSPGRNNEDDSKNITSTTLDVEVDQSIDKEDIESINLSSDMKNGNLTNVSERLPMKHADTIDSAVQKIFEVEQSLVEEFSLNDVYNGDTKKSGGMKGNGSNQEQVERKPMVYLDIENEDGGDAWLGMLSDLVTDRKSVV